MIREGQTGLYLQLWRQVEGFVIKNAGHYLAALDARRWLEIEDLAQAGYLAMVDAVAGYERDRASFLTYLKYHLRRRFREAAGILSTRTAKDPIASHISLDQPVGEDLTLGDLQAGESKELEDAERRIWLEQLHEAIEKALAKLPPNCAEAIRARYLYGLSLQEAAEAAGVPVGTIWQRVNHGITIMRRRARLDGLDRFLDDRTNFYSRPGRKSPVEHLAIRRDSLRRKYERS